MRWWSLGLLLAALVVACAGGPTDTTGSPSSSPQWAAEAEAWRAASYEAAHEGIVNELHFLAEDVVFEDRTGGREIRGRDDFIAFARDFFFGGGDPSSPMALLLSAEGMLDQYQWIEGGLIDWLDRVEMGPEGTERMVIGASVASGRRYAPGARDFDAIEALADRYVALWNRGDAGGAPDLYVPGATIEDTLLGSSVAGIGEIVAAVGSGQWPDLPQMVIGQLPPWSEDISPPPPPRGRAIYISPSDVNPTLPDEVRIIVEVDDGSGCPGLLGVNLAWDGERVLWERRYHELESVRRCLDTEGLQPGWWEGMVIPEPVRMDPTGTMTWEERGVSVQIYNGTAETESFLRWGLERFARAGLPLPEVDSVIFLSQESTCRGFGGFWNPEAEGATILLCYSADEIGLEGDGLTWTARSRRSLLHEYAHAWIDRNLDEEVRAAFLDCEGVPRWNDPADPWEDRGQERAADTIMFGLFDELVSGWLDPEGGCEHSQQGFRLLTGVEPISTCPP